VHPHSDESNLAIFADYENLALGVQRANFDKFDIEIVLDKLLDKGRVLVKKAYCDWKRYADHRRALHEAGFELLEVPHISYGGKNSADIHMVVDALDMCYTRPHIDTFVILSGDSDFSPLVRKLRENNKVVIGLGVKSSSGDLLVENCDEFIYYDDLVRKKKVRRTRDKAAEKAAEKPADPAAKAAAKSEPKAAADRGRSGKPQTEAAKAEAKPADPKPAEVKPPKEGGSPEEALQMVLDTAESMMGEREGALWGSMVKQALKRKRPSFDETWHGYRSFADLLEDAQKRGMLELQADERSGGYIITRLGPAA
jgi:uncharacterized protein (TIGR00288 family)